MADPQRDILQNIKDAARIFSGMFSGRQMNIFALMKDYILNYFKYGIIGNSIRLDASNICQLKCPACFQAKEGDWTIKKSFLKFSDFKRLVDENPTFRNIELSDDGEIFLNPQLKDIIKYAHSRKISLTARNGVNLNNADDETLEYAVKHGFKVLVVSIDGISNKTYSTYRQGGNLNQVIGNIKRINYYKQKYNTELPVMIWQFIIFGHNENELPAARKMARELNMRFMPIFNCVRSYSPVKDRKLVTNEMGYASREEYEDKTKDLYIFPCLQLWLSPQISPDGELLGCCANLAYPDTFGNVFKLGLRDCLKSEKFIRTRRVLFGKAAAGEDLRCFHCFIYQRMLSRKINLILNIVKKLKRFYEDARFG